MTLAVAMPTAAELISRALERQYIRDGIGQFADIPGVGDGAPLSAKLKGAGRIDLLPGELLLRSDRTKGENGRAWLAVTEKDGRKSLRIGLGNAQFGTRRDDNGPWRAERDRSYEINEERQDLIARREDLENEIEELEADPNTDSAGLAARRAQLDELYDADTDEVIPNGHTAILDEDGARQLRETLDKALDDGEKKQAAFDEIDQLESRRYELSQIVTREFTDDEDAEWDRITGEIERLEAGLKATQPSKGYWTFAEGSIPGEWADVHYNVYLDDPSIGVETKLAAIPHHYDETFDDMSEATASFDIADADEFIQLLAKMESGRSPESINRSDLGVRLMSRLRLLEKYDPHQLRDSGGEDGGQWVKQPGGSGGTLDKLKLAGRAPAGFTVQSSKKLKTDYADVGVAEVDGPDGPHVRVGIIGGERGKWDAGFTGESRKAELRQQISEKQRIFDNDDDAPDDIEDQISELESELEDLDNERTAVVSPEKMADFRRQLGDGLEAAIANKAQVDADAKAQDAIDEKRNAIIAEHSDAALERKISKAAHELRSARKTVKSLENELEGGSLDDRDREYTAGLLSRWKADVAEHDAELAPLLARRAQLVPADALARLEDLDRQYRALNERDITEMLTSAEVSAPNGTRVRAEIWGSDDIDEQFVNTRLLVLTPGETTADVTDLSDDYSYFSGLKGLSKLIAGLDASHTPESNRSDLGVRSMPAIRALEALSSPAVQLMMLARTIEARDIISRRGRQVVVERGRGGKFAEMGSIGDVVDAVQKAAGASHSDEHGYRAGMLSRPRAERRGWLASQMQQYGGADDTSDRVEQVATGMGIDTSGVSRYQASGKKNISEMLDLMVGSANAEDDAASVLAPSVPKPRRSAVAKAMSSGDTNALDGFGREALRREARARGIDVPRGAHEDVIKDMLWDNDHNEYAETFKAPEPDRPKPGGSASGLGRDSSEEEIFAAFNRMGSEQEIKDALAGKDADTLRFLGEEIGVRTHRNDTDPEKIKAHIARSVAVGLSNVRFRSGGGNDRDVVDAAPAPSAKPARTSRAKPDMGSVLDTLAAKRDNPQAGDREAVAEMLGKLKSHADLDAVAERFGYSGMKGTREKKRAELVETLVGRKLDHDAVLRASSGDGRPPATQEEANSYFASFANAFKATQQADRERALAKKAAAEQDAPKAARHTKAVKPDRAESMAAISGRSDVWGDLRKAHEEEGARPVEPMRPMAAKIARPARASRPKAADKPDRAESLKAISGGKDVWAGLRQAHDEDDQAKPTVPQDNSAKVARVNEINAMLLRGVTDPDERRRLQVERRRLGDDVMNGGANSAKLAAATRSELKKVQAKRDRLQARLDRSDSTLPYATTGEASIRRQIDEAERRMAELRRELAGSAAGAPVPPSVPSGLPSDRELVGRDYGEIVGRLTALNLSDDDAVRYAAQLKIPGRGNAKSSDAAIRLIASHYGTNTPAATTRAGREGKAAEVASRLRSNMSQGKAAIRDAIQAEGLDVPELKALASGLGVPLGARRSKTEIIEELAHRLDMESSRGTVR